jgi:hypothetical protein
VACEVFGAAVRLGLHDARDEGQGAVALANEAAPDEGTRHDERVAGEPCAIEARGAELMRGIHTDTRREEDNHLDAAPSRLRALVLALLAGLLGGGADAGARALHVSHGFATIASCALFFGAGYAARSWKPAVAGAVLHAAVDAVLLVQVLGTHAGLGYAGAVALFDVVVDVLFAALGSRQVR